MKSSITLLLFFSLLMSVNAANMPAREIIRVASDGFPAGQETPEGAACDLARAFIKRDAGLFTNVCLSFPPTATPPEYAAFLQQTVDSINKEAARKKRSKRGPKAIGKVYAARLIATGASRLPPGFQQIKFVDVGLVLEDGSRTLRRTLVLRDRVGRWYVHPAPQISRDLAPGLNQETGSKDDFTKVYEPLK